MLSAVAAAIALQTALAEPIVLREGLAIQSVGRSGRTPIVTDAIAARIARGTFETPKEGDAIPVPGGEARTWAPIKAGEDGAFTGPALRGGYVHLTHRAEREEVVILHAVGHNMVVANGEPRAGDPYGFGYVQLPVKLKRGVNEFLFSVGRGRLTARLIPVQQPLVLGLQDPTFPDYLVGERHKELGALMLTNATGSMQTNLAIRVDAGQGRTALTSLPPIAPLTARKVGFDLPVLAVAAPGQVPLTIELVRLEGSVRRVVSRVEVKLEAKSPTQMHKRTFRSQIDGSVQYYAVQPATTTGPGKAMILSVHGASVEATNQANAYGPKSWANVVCATNRRPYGFDWEEWGRMDAMEVLANATERYRPDPSRIYLTGHSMGGHGTWHLGVTYPDRFAAIGPSAGWISFFSYGGGRRIENPDPVEDLVQRASNPSDTLLRIQNLAPLGVYILHSDKDESVPVSEAREMAKRLGEFHKDFQYYEKLGVGHWWDDDDEPGASCLDWPPMYDLFARRNIPTLAETRYVRFTTVNPGISSRMRWAEIRRQERPLMPSTVDFRLDPLLRRFSGTTSNVETLSFDLRGLSPGEVAFVVDGQEVKSPWPTSLNHIALAKRDGKWGLAEPVPALHKSPLRAGPIKEAMTNGFVLVYGTKGNAAENAWAFAKARYDAEQFGYRGNGSPDLIPDTVFNVRDFVDRTVVLYGNSTTNSQWQALLGQSPVQVGKRLTVDGKPIEGDDLAVFFCRPRRDSEIGSVVAVSGTSLTGMRVNDRFPVFTSGAGYPDLFVADASLFEVGSQGVRGAGFFGNDWSVAAGEFAWR